MEGTGTGWAAVIVNYNSGEDLPGCLAALRAARPMPTEIVVVDNASADDSLAILAREEGIRVLSPPENLGFAGGANVGIAATTSPFVATLNPDIALEPGWPAALLSDFGRDPRLGAAGGKLLYPDRETIQFAGGRLQQPRMFASLIGRGEIDTGQHDTPQDVDFVTSAALMLRRAALDQVGLFDDGYFPAYYGEVDLCWRLARAGWAVRVIPVAVAIHRETITRDAWAPRHRFLSHIHRLRFALQHLERRRILTELLPLEEQAFAVLERADDHAKGLEQQLADVQEAYRHLAAHADDLDRALRRANPFKNRLRALLRMNQAR